MTKHVGLFFLGGGAFLAILGGLFACCFNCRWYVDFGDNRRVYQGPNSQVAKCALSSGIIGVICAAIGIIAVLITISGGSKTITTLMYGITLILYIGEVIPEAILLGNTQWGVESDTFGSSIMENLEQYIFVPILQADWYQTDSEFQWWVDYSALEQTKYAPTDTETQNMAEELQYLIDELNGYRTATSYYFPPNAESVEPVAKYAKHSCIIDYNKSVINIDYIEFTNCSALQIETVQCVGGWSSTALTNSLRDICNQQQLLLEESIILIENIPFEDAQLAFIETLNAEQKMVSSLFTEDSVYALDLANRAIVSIQTVGWIITMFGVITFPFSEKNES